MPSGPFAILLPVLAVFSSLKPGFQWSRRHMSTTEREQLFLTIPNPGNALAVSRAYATHPHLAGSSEDFVDAKSILQVFHEELGIPVPHDWPVLKAGSASSRNATLHLTARDAPTHPTAWIDTYYPVLNTGLEQVLQIVDDTDMPVWTADLLEDGDPRDPEAHKFRTSIPPWHGLSADGDVTGQLIYANYGTKEDYDEVVSQGTNLTGKIVLVRYGRIYRGLKIKRAEELGAAGVMIFSDPSDDGCVTVSNGYAPYPAGPARNPSSIQRGSALYLSKYPGDPTTPGYPAYENAERKEGFNIPRIPSLPISWQNAQTMLKEIEAIYTVRADGTKVLSGNSSASRIRLANRVNTKVTPIWNVMASIPGYIKNEVVIIGCHRDAWVMGAVDPASSTVTLLEVIRGFGVLLREGWKPLRTVIIANWDAEEYGLVGSTEWGEDFAQWISDHAVAYLNADISVAGSRWVVAGSPSLAHLIKGTSKDVPHPTKEGKTLWDAIDDDGPFKRSFLPNSSIIVDPDVCEMHTKKEEERKASQTKVQPLGSGSDFTVFLQRLGVASSDQGFGFTLSDPVYHYHSVYDSQAWQERYGDPGFSRHVAVAKYYGLAALRLLDAIVLPLNTTQYALELDDYLTRVENLLPLLGKNGPVVTFFNLRGAIRELQEASFKLDTEKKAAEDDFRTKWRTIHDTSWRFQTVIGFVPRFANWIKQLCGIRQRHIVSWEEFLELAADSDIGDNVPHVGISLPLFRAARRVLAVNRKLIMFERGFISEEGIKDREWYKHLGVAPGKWLGYGATTFPGLTEAITCEKNVTLVRQEALRLEELFTKLAATITP